MIHEEQKKEEEKRIEAGTNLRDARGQVLKAAEKPKDDGKIRDARGQIIQAPVKPSEAPKPVKMIQSVQE